MTTFLEFLCERMFGPPLDRRGDGQSEWEKCPKCGAGPDKFHTRPAKPGFADKFGCYRCGVYGDEFDAVWSALPAS